MGLPIAFALTGGEVSDYKGYLPTMNADGPTPKVLLADTEHRAVPGAQEDAQAMTLTSFEKIWSGVAVSR